MIKYRYVILSLIAYAMAIVATIAVGFISGFSINPEYAGEKKNVLNEVAMSTRKHPISSENLDRIYAEQNAQREIGADGTILQDAALALRWHRILLGIICAVLLMLVKPPIKELALTAAVVIVLALSVISFDVAVALLLSSTVYILIYGMFLLRRKSKQGVP